MSEENKVQRHNRLAPELVRTLVMGTVARGDGVPAMLTLLESVAMGVLEVAARSGDDETAARREYLDAFVQGLTERVAALGASRRDDAR